MNWKIILSGIGIILVIVGCSGSDNTPIKLKRDYPESFRISVKNPITIDRKDEAVVLSVTEIKKKYPDFNPNAFIVLSNGKELASQKSNLNNDEDNQILFVSDFKSRERKNFTIRYAKTGVKIRKYQKRTQAELSHKFGGHFVNRKYRGGTFQNVHYLRVPPEHTDHSGFIRYEGPGWESDKVGYRFYLDWRNAIDIFGKKVTKMILQNVGLDGFDSYHKMSDWGMDVFKVGNSLGVGSFGMWYQNKANRVEKTDSVICTIKDNGPVFSRVHTVYYNWDIGGKKVDLTSDLSIWAGSRLTHCQLAIEEQIDNMCTGLAKHENTDFMKKLPKTPDEWGYIALWGNQSLAGRDDQLGTAVLYHGSQFSRITEDDLNYVVILKPEGKIVDYYFLAAWDQEPNGIQSEDGFVNYLEETVSKLNTPLVIKFK